MLTLLKKNILFCNRNGNKIFKYRKANITDCDAIYDWENDKATREMSLNTNLFSFSSHLEWYSRALEDKNITLYVVLNNKSRVALIRFDKVKNNLFESSIILNKNYRSKGLSKDILKNGISLLKEQHKMSEIVASIKKNNIASIKCFTYNNFIFKYTDGILNFYEHNNLL